MKEDDLLLIGAAAIAGLAYLNLAAGSAAQGAASGFGRGIAQGAQAGFDVLQEEGAETINYFSQKEQAFEGWVGEKYDAATTWASNLFKQAQNAAAPAIATAQPVSYVNTYTAPVVSLVQQKSGLPTNVVNSAYAGVAAVNPLMAASLNWWASSGVFK